jgi:CelD/BcsL family acetyltransferase involved in cellulose biosynthesis
MAEVTIKTAEGLSRDERDAWRAFQARAPEIASPYFSLGYLDAMADVRGDVRVVVRSEAGAPVAFLPLQVGLMGHARPLGGPLSDHHGLIGEVTDGEAMTEMLARAGVSVFDFHGALGTQAPFAELGSAPDGSWVIDLRDGFDAWRSRRKKPGGNTLRTILVSERKLTERHGEVEFCFDDRSPEALEAMFAWKSDQYRRTGHFDVFSVVWTRRLVDALRRSEAETGARGVVSSLKVDGELAAIHFGMMGGGVMHYWFPAYDPAFQKEGSGNALLVRILEAAKDQGLSEIHLGGGDYRYKAALADWQFPIVSGFAGKGAVAAARRLAQATETLAADVKLGPLTDLPGRVFRRIDRMAGFRAA